MERINQKKRKILQKNNGNNYVLSITSTFILNNNTIKLITFNVQQKLANIEFPDVLYKGTTRSFCKTMKIKQGFLNSIQHGKATTYFFLKLLNKES